MKDELIDNLNAKIERNRKITAAASDLLGINKLLMLIPRIKYPKFLSFTEASSFRNFLRSFS